MRVPSREPTNDMRISRYIQSPVMNEYTFNSVSDCDSVPFDWIFYEQDYKQDVFPTHGHNYSYAFAQTPTPMQSHGASPAITEHIEERGSYRPEEDTVVSVSTAFHPGAHPTGSDLVLSSSDSVLFYVHSRVIRAVSEHAFRMLTPRPYSKLQYEDPMSMVNVPEISSVLNVIIHMLYDTSSAQHSPSSEILITAVNRMPFYEIDPKLHITPSTSLYTLLLSHAPLVPLEIYALASHFDLHELAVSTSSHLLSYPLATITDDMAERIGAVYLKRLLSLHVDRANALKRILLLPPHPHPQTRECDFTEQKKLTRAWALVSAYLAWDARPDLSTHSIQSALNPLTEHLTCKLCHQTLSDRIRDAVVQWASVKRTI